jgi:citrate lyase subunit beta/citryl-CoA lyase
MSRPIPVWRSLLFVPVTVPRFVETAHTRGADGCILDLEDAVAPGEKAHARTLVAGAAASIAARGLDVLVRINRPWRLAVRDVEHSVSPHVCALALPKVADAGHVRGLAEVVGEVERERGLEVGHTRLVVMVETVEALPEARAIAAAHPRVAGITLGGEDFSVSAGMTPQPDLLVGPSQEVLFAARAAGCLALGLIGSIAEFRDLDAFRVAVEMAAHLGFEGSFCIHPAQVPVLNEVFSPSPDVVARARALVAAYDRALAEGLGAIELDGRMIDVPVADRARAVVEMAERIAARGR